MGMMRCGLVFQEFFFVHFATGNNREIDVSESALIGCKVWTSIECMSPPHANLANWVGDCRFATRDTPQNGFVSGGLHFI